MPHRVPRERQLSPDDPAVRPGWPLLKFLHSVGADEFGLRFIYAGNDARPLADRLAARLDPYFIGTRERECVAGYDFDTKPRQVEVWRLSPQSIATLRDLFPGGLFGARVSPNAWAEDLCVYRGGRLVLGTVTHEEHAFLRLTDAEWQEWLAATTG